MNLRGKHLWISLPALLLATGTALAGSQVISECGAVLTEPGNYRLANDLVDCPADGVFIDGSDISLDLKGHEISCADVTPLAAGVAVIGTEEAVVSNVTVRNGRVSNCNDGIVFVFTENSKITKISSTGNRRFEGWGGTGITVWLSNHNVIMKNRTFGNAGDGIFSGFSSGNVFKHNRSYDNFDGAGITAEAVSDSLFMCNHVSGNLDGINMQGPSDGYPMFSTDNLLQGNYSSYNFGAGINMMGFKWDGWPYGADIPENNTIRLNIAEHNGYADFLEIYFDLVTWDVTLHPDETCLNTWEKNRFGTELGPAGCFGVPFDLDEVCAMGGDDD